jgi:predicted ribosomally synthesized peptide with SipW-like signal peptide
MSDEKFSISRRKALAGLGTIGVAGGLGLGGTYAQFTDTEENSVTFTAGGIDGTIEWSGHYNGNDVTGDLTNVSVGEGASDVNGTVHFEDIKPGDFGCVNFKITVQNNPAWVASCLDYSNDIDYKNYEPEIEADDEVSTTGESETPGELADNMLTIPYYDSDGSCQFFDQNGVELPDACTVPSGFWSNAENDGSSGGDDGYLAPRTIADVASSGGWKNTIRWNSGDQFEIPAPEGASVGEGCVFLDGGQAGEDSTDNTRTASVLQPGDELYFGYDFHLPFETGNVAQGDRMDLHLGFNFLQARHTEAPNFGSYSPGENTPNDS